VLAVGCAGRQVLIEAREPRVRRAVAATFGQACQPPQGNPIARLTLRRVRGGYAILGSCEPHSADGTLADALRSLRYQATLHLIAVRPDLVWLHAAAVARDGRALLIAGPGGSGKSSLATELVGVGFRYLGDDVIPLDPVRGIAYPFPVTPTVRSRPSGPLPREAVATLPRFAVALDAIRVAPGPVPVGLVLFPGYARRLGEVRPWPPARTAVDLIRHCLNFKQHGEHMVRALCSLAATWPAIGLRFDDAGRAAQALAAAVANGRAAARAAAESLPRQYGRGDDGAALSD
jgi:hypothetical protein